MKTLRIGHSSVERSLRENGILVVEDDFCLQAILRRAFAAIEPKARVEWLATGEEAIQRLSEQEFSLIVADYRLSGESTGLDLWRHCAVRYPGVPYVMMSSLSVPDFFGIFGKGALVPPFLPKPFYPQEFCRLVQGALS